MIRHFLWNLHEYSGMMSGVFSAMRLVYGTHVYNSVIATKNTSRIICVILQKEESATCVNLQMFITITKSWAWSSYMKIC